MTNTITLKQMPTGIKSMRKYEIYVFDGAIYEQRKNQENTFGLAGIPVDNYLISVSIDDNIKFKNKLAASVASTEAVKSFALSKLSNTNILNDNNINDMGVFELSELLEVSK